ncbi:MAG: Integrase [Massilia sp.]|nr:Integrase [Massilia sp.]
MAHTKANIKFAERLRGEILNAIEKGGFSYAKYFPESSYLAKFGIKQERTDVTVGQLLDDQFAIYKRTLASSTYKVYRRSYARLKAKWGTTQLLDLTPAALRAWIGDFDTKARTIRQLLIPLRGALDLAVNDDLIEGSPMDRVKLRKILGRDAYKVDFVADPFSAAEIAAILSVCTGQERNVWQFAFATGMRPSEYIALRWESIDFSRLTVRVERARVLGTTTDEVKTYAGKRSIDIRQGAYDALMAQKQHSALANGLVFLDPSHGEGWNSAGRLYSLWEKIVERSGVRPRNPYQTRHTFASTLLSTGENQMYVAKQMGHADTTMITRTYGKWLEQEGGALPDFYRKLVPGAARAIR